MKYNRDSEKMGTAPISGLLLKLSIPSILAALVNNLYNVVDSIFVAQLNEKALTALSLAAPIQILMAALGAGMATGINAVISRSLGEKNDDAVKSAVKASIFLAGCSYLLILIMQFVLLRPFFAWQTKDVEILEYGIAYLQICMLFSFGCMLQWVFDRFLISTGKTSCFMISLASASVTNLILDPILIFGRFGFPALGITGAGYATVIGQIVGAVVSILLNVYKNKEIPISVTWKPEKKALAGILKVGFPAALMHGMTSVSGMLINAVLIGFSSTAVAIYGICLKIQNVFMVVPHGIDLAMTPIVAYNFGAKKPKREKQAFGWGMIYSMIFMAFAVLFLEIFPQKILLLFNASQHMLSMGATAIRILALSMFISVYSLLLGAVLQALGKGVSSMLLTIARQMIFLLPLVFLFKMTNQISVIWFAFPIAEILGALVGLYYHKKYFSFHTTTQLVSEQKKEPDIAKINHFINRTNKVKG